MSTLTIESLQKKFSIDEIEKNILFNYVQINNLEYSKSEYLTRYFGDFVANAELLNHLKSIGHNSIEDIVIDMGILMPESDKKTNGAFFTPQYIVDYIIEQVNPLEHDKVIDLSCGSGAFLLGIIRFFQKKYNKSIKDIVAQNLFGADILDYNIRRSKAIISLYALKNNEIGEIGDNLITTDSLKYKWNFKFDAVVGNPPYVKFQDLDNQTRKYLIEEYSTTKLGTYNLYFAFFEKGLEILKGNGKLGYITPNNYFTSLAGEPLRAFFQNNKSIYQIVDFNSTKVFEVQTYTAITFLDKNSNDYIKYDKIAPKEKPVDFLNNVDLTPNYYSDLATKKWRLLCGNERQNINSIENKGLSIGSLFNICTGIATLKDEVYTFDTYEEDEQYYYVTKKERKYQIEKAITKPLVKISDIKNSEDLKLNKKRIIFPYTNTKGKMFPIQESVLERDYPMCYNYFVSVQDILSERDKGKHSYSPFYAYGRTQGLNRNGLRIYTPTFSLKPRFIMDSDESAYFTNGYAIFFDEKESNNLFSNPIARANNADVLLKIINSSVMDYYITKTSVTIEGGYPCYQKNFIEKFSIPDLNDRQISEIRNLSANEDIDNYLYNLYQLNLSEPNLSA